MEDGDAGSTGGVMMLVSRSQLHIEYFEVI
jgi:hypothetical protein